MATIKFQEPYEQFSGRDSAKRTAYGSVAFNRNLVPLARNFVYPRQPNTYFQGYAKIIFQAAAQSWTALSDSDKDSWGVLALTITYTNTHGFTYHPTARNLYIKAYITASRNAATPPTTAPTTITQNVCLPATALVRGTAGGFTGVFCTFTDTPILGWLAFDFAGPVSPSTRSTRGLNYIFPGWLPIGAPAWGGMPPDSPPKVSDFVVYTATSAPNPTFINDLWTILDLSAGKRYAVRITPVEQTAYIPGNPQYSLITITT